MEHSQEYRDGVDEQDEELTGPSSVSIRPVTTCRASIARERHINEIRGAQDVGDATRNPKDPIAYPEHDQVPADEDKVMGFLNSLLGPCT